MHVRRVRNALPRILMEAFIIHPANASSLLENWHASRAFAGITNSTAIAPQCRSRLATQCLLMCGSSLLNRSLGISTTSTMAGSTSLEMPSLSNLRLHRQCDSRTHPGESCGSLPPLDRQERPDTPQLELRCPLLLPSLASSEAGAQMPESTAYLHARGPSASVTMMPNTMSRLALNFPTMMSRKWELLESVRAKGKGKRR